MNADTDRPGNASAGFAMAAAITALFNTTLACVKDAYHPLQIFMNAIAGHNCTTQGLADVILFVVLVLVFSNARSVQLIRSERVITFLVAAVVVSGIGLFARYALF